MQFHVREQLLENKTFEEIQPGDMAVEEKELSQADLNVFAVLSHDLNPTHLDLEYAKGQGFADTTVHSMLSGSLFSFLLGTKLPGPGTVYLSQNLNFHQSLLSHEKVEVKIMVKEKFFYENTPIVVFDCQVKRVATNELIITGQAKVKAPTEKIRYQLKNQMNVTVVDKHAKYQELLNKARKFEKSRMAIVYPCDKPSLSGVVGAVEENLIEPVIIGPVEKILAIAKEIGKDISSYEMINEISEKKCAELAVEMVRQGRVSSIMKGSLHTDELMGAVVNRTTGIRSDTRISHVFYMDVPRYSKPLLITDAAVNIEPDFEAKVDIVKNAITLAKALDIEVPKVAILAAVETVNPKMKSTMEAAALCKMADRGQIKGAILDGPLAFDNAISLQAAQTKGIKSQVSGDADILLAPNLEAGNIFAKQLEYLADAVSAGIVLGAQVPIALTSRADNEKVRIASAALCVILAHYQKSQKIV